MPRMTMATYYSLMDGVQSLTYAIGTVNEPFLQRQLTLTGNMLVDSLNAALKGVDGHIVRDVDFAFRDAESMIRDAGFADEPAFETALAALRPGIDEIHELGALSQEMRTRIGSLSTKMRERYRAAERATFLPPGSTAPPLPHDPATLQIEAASLREQINVSGFETEALDRLADHPGSFEVRDCSALVDELEAILS